MKIEPLEINALQVGLDHLLESLFDTYTHDCEDHEDRMDISVKIGATRQTKAKLDKLQKAIESEGGFSSLEILINE